MTDEEALQRFRIDVSKFSGAYSQFLIIAQTSDGKLFWKATDDSFGIGVATRYVNIIKTRDTLEESNPIESYDDEIN